MMKIRTTKHILALLLLLSHAELTLASKLSSTANRVLARELLTAIDAALFTPNILDNSKTSAYHRSNMVAALYSKLRAREDILQDYLDLWRAPTDGDGKNLAAAIYSILKETADAYVAEASTNTRTKLFWDWRFSNNKNVGKFDDDERVRLLQQVMLLTLRIKGKFREHQQGSTDLLQLHQHLAERLHGANRQAVAETNEFYTEFPELSLSLNNAQAAQIYAYLDGNDVNLDGFNKELHELIITTLSKIESDDIISLQQKLTLNNIVTSKTPIDQSQGLREGKMLTDIKQLWHHSSLFANIDGMAWDVSWDELRTDRFLSSATGELLSQMNWSWSDLSKVVSPHNAQAAALFLDTFKEGNNVEILTRALLAKKNTLPADRAVHIDNFLSELPHLEEKRKLMSTIKLAHKLEFLNTDSSELATLEGASPRAVIDLAITNYMYAEARWQYLTVDTLLQGKGLYTPALTIAYTLRTAGATAEQLRTHIFTDAIYDKLLTGESISALELQALQRLLDKEKVLALIEQLDIDKDAHQHLLTAILVLPIILQLESFAQEFAAGEASNAKFIALLEKTPEDSMYAPLARSILRYYRTPPQPNNPRRGRKKRKAAGVKELSTIRGLLRQVGTEAFESRQGYLTDYGKSLFYAFTLENNREFFRIGQADHRIYLDDDYNPNQELLRTQELENIVAPQYKAATDLIFFVYADGISLQDLQTVLLEFYGEQGHGQLYAAPTAEVAGFTVGSATGWLKKLQGEFTEEEVGQFLSAASQEAAARRNRYGYIPRQLPPASEQLPPTAAQGNSKVAQKQPRERKTQDLARRVIELQKKIGRQGLPPDTPPWLRLRAIMSYMDTTPQELMERAALQAITEERFAELLAPDTTAVPRREELLSIRTALQAMQTPKRKQRKLEDSGERKLRQARLENVEREMRAMLSASDPVSDN